MLRTRSRLAASAAALLFAGVLAGQSPSPAVSSEADGRPIYTKEDLELLRRAESLDEKEISSAIRGLAEEMMKSRDQAAAEVMGPGNVRRLDVRGYPVLTDVSSESEVRGMVEGYDVVRAAFSRLFPVLRDPKTAFFDKPFFILFRRREAYENYCVRGFGPARVDPTGHYTSNTRCLVLSAEPSRHGEALRALLHESAHDMVRTYAVSPRQTVLRWIDEGMASMFEGVLAWEEPEPGRESFPPVVIPADFKHGALNPFGKRRAVEMAEFLHGEAFPGFAALLGPADWEGMDDVGRSLRYHAAFSAVHFLVFGEGGKRRDAFVGYLGDPEHGGDRANRDILASEMEAGLRRHIDRMAPRLRQGFGGQGRLR